MLTILQRRNLRIEPAEQRLKAVRARNLRLLLRRQHVVGIVCRLNRLVCCVQLVLVHFGKCVHTGQGIDHVLNSLYRQCALLTVFALGVGLIGLVPHFCFTGLVLGFRLTGLVPGFCFTGLALSFRLTGLAFGSVLSGFTLGFRLAGLAFGSVLSGFTLSFVLPGLALGFRLAGLALSFGLTGLALGFRLAGLILGLPFAFIVRCLHGGDTAHRIRLRRKRRRRH